MNANINRPYVSNDYQMLNWRNLGVDDSVGSRI